MSIEAQSPTAHIAENEPTRAYFARPGGGRALDPDLDGYKRFRAWFTRPLLTRPAILDAEQTRRLDHDLPVLLETLQSLPERLFAGDEQAFARAIGWHQPTVAQALETLSGPAVPLGRADLVNTPAGFQMVEFNTSSSLGSMEFGELCRAVLTDDAFGDFADSEQLSFQDPLTMMVDTMLRTTGFGPADRPVVALVEWPTTEITVNASLFVDLLVDLGFRVLTCTLADLELTGAGLYVDDVRIDIVYRVFLLKAVAEDEHAPELLRPLVQAVSSGAVRLFSPVNADLYGTKTCMALLSDERNRDAFTPAELDVIDRALPWTRSMADAENVAADEGGSLAEYVLAHQEELVLKPGIGHAGLGVVAGWLHPPEEWARHVRTAARGDHIVQRRAYSVAERFPGATPADPPTACFLHWGLFVTGAGLSGGFVKGLPDRPQDVRYLGDGSHVGCIFHSTA
ncbi:MAG: hypothetical protein ACJ786_04100 [Catenulispora sp.]